MLITLFQQIYLHIGGEFLIKSSACWNVNICHLPSRDNIGETFYPLRIYERVVILLFV